MRELGCPSLTQIPFGRQSRVSSRKIYIPVTGHEVSNCMVYFYVKDLFIYISVYVLYVFSYEVDNA